MPNAIDMLSALGAALAAAAVFIAVCLAPALFFSDSVMFVWTFWAAFPGIFIAHRVGGKIRAIIRKKLA